MEDWKRAQTAAVSELPPLNGDQKEVARKFGLSEEKYARSFLSLLYGQERMQNRGADLGKTLEEILGEMGPDYHLLAVVSDADKYQWVAEIRTHGQVVDVAIPQELADDFLDSGRELYRDQIRSLVLNGGGRKGPARN